jgi:photoactive yellow protein
MTEMLFSAPDLLHQLDRLAHHQLDEINFGIIRMDHNGKIEAYNRAESLITGVNPIQALGKHFFTQIAPCTNNFMVASRFEQERVDEEIDYIFTYVTRPTKVRLRMLRAQQSPYQYLLVKPI